MTFNHEVLFLHLGKTGGTSVSWLLCNTLQPPVFNIFQKGILKNAKTQGYEIHIEGNRHANLLEARVLLEKYGMKIENFKLILAMVRNPVDLEFSHYRHLRKEKVLIRAHQPGTDKLKKRVAAAQGSFEDFALTNLTHYEGKLKDFFTIDNQLPENLNIVRNEKMNEVLLDILQPFQKYFKPLPHRNKSVNQEDKTLSLKALENIYRKYKWIYDRGFYELPF